MNATPLGGVQYKIDDQPVPDDELWEFPPGSVVECEYRELDGGPALVATNAASPSSIG